MSYLDLATLTPAAAGLRFWVPRTLFAPEIECFRHIFYWGVIIAAVVLNSLSRSVVQVTPIVYFTVPYMLRLCQYIQAGSIGKGV